MPVAEFERLSGWELKPEGACRGDVCIPLPPPAAGIVDVGEIAAALGMPLVHDPEAELWALGPVPGPAVTEAAAPDFTLPERGGRPLSLSSLRGRKVAVVAWAPW